MGVHIQDIYDKESIQTERPASGLWEMDENPNHFYCIFHGKKRPVVKNVN